MVIHKESASYPQVGTICSESTVYSFYSGEYWELFSLRLHTRRERSHSMELLVHFW